MRPMTYGLFALSVAALSVAVAGPVLAQSAPPAGQTEGAWKPPRSALSSAIPTLAEDTALQAAVASEARPVADRARDAARHPYESLTFWGLTPGMTVVEIEPGGASWWRHILEPYAAGTGGRYVPVNRPLESMGVAEGSADLILVARAFHNWARDGRTQPYLQAFYKALKPGGVLAVEQHRSAEGLNVADVASTGYVPESYVIREARNAGFVLEARSELNANPRDDHDHPFGVWTLPPVRRSAASDDPAAPRLSAEERAAFDAIGESDRMTLRFRKPE
ncbi:class I SAM-dependent methyltransferase [Brevundimonas sp. SORGH_AS_0993]|uniref:class I SAM-dependent methyltransferase n=1 Tax=Brevundimonas sp. SORGH_AS_0993 TaxID=3041794 RepID=UPI002783EB1A|nr:methyltransferase [Brevundimonas sp. SORGH_AS_0993]MDQ1154687.1 putative methyltransferase [Brevundimonas sp. SORGH_AS_0993]